jgi:hypothetical protein
VETLSPPPGRGGHPVLGILRGRVAATQQHVRDAMPSETDKQQGESSMELTLIGCRFHGRKGKGKWDLVYDAKMPSGAQGKIARSYEFEDRDTISDEYHSSPNIANEVKKILADNEDTMDIWEGYFSFPNEEQEDKLSSFDMTSLGSLVLVASY